MTRRDYVLIAAEISGANATARRCTGRECAAAVDAALERVVGGLCDAFVADNPRFDRARFYAACGIDDEGLS